MLLRPWLCFHLWYLTAYIQVLIVVIVALRLGKLRLLWCLSPLFVLLGLLLGGYGFLFPALPQNLLFSRNFITIGIPCFGMGWLLRQYKDRVVQVVTRPFLLVFLLLVLSAIEVFVLYANVSSRGDYLIFTMPLSVALVVCCLTHPALGSGSVLEYIGQHFSIDIFIYHVFIGSLLAKVQQYICFPQPAMPFLIFVATAMFAFVWHNALKRYLQH